MCVKPYLCVNTYGLLYIKEMVKQCSGGCDDHTLNLIACDVQKQINLVGRAFMEICDHGKFRKYDFPAKGMGFL